MFMKAFNVRIVKHNQSKQIDLCVLPVVKTIIFVFIATVEVSINNTHLLF